MMIAMLAVLGCSKKKHAEEELPDPYAIQPASLSAPRVEYELPGVVEDLAVGGGGRFLVLRFAELGQLGVFDLNEAKLAGLVRAEGETIGFAASAKSLFVVEKKSGTLKRFDLATRELEDTSKLPVTPVGQIAIGSGSEGPLLVTGGEEDWGELQYFDPEDLKPRTIRQGDDWVKFDTRAEAEHEVTVATDGKCFAFHRISLIAVTVGDGTASAHHSSRVGDWAVPSPSGDRIYAEKGVFSAKAERIGSKADARPFIPATRGDYALSWDLEGVEYDAPEVPVTVHHRGDSEPVLEISKVRLPLYRELPPHKRIVFVPDAKVIVTLPKERNRLILHRVDIEKLLEQSATNRLFFTSKPPEVFEPGKRFAYQLEAKSTAGEPEFFLDDGPEGMEIALNGRLSWQVPASESNPQNIIVRVRDSSGAERLQAFEIKPRISGSTGTAAVLPARPGLEPDRNPVGSSNELAIPRLPEISPPEMEAANVEVKLPAAFGDLVIGGGGRYVIVHLPDLRKIAVFDVNAANVVKQLPAPSDRIFLAAGADALLAYDRKLGILQRWSLEGEFERERTGRIELKHEPEWMAMGSASAGPLAIGGGGNPSSPGKAVFLNPKTLKTIPYKQKRESGSRGLPDMDPAQVRASADGNAFAGWILDSSPSGIYFSELNGSTETTRYQHLGARFVVPDASGNLLYTAKGVFASAELTTMKRRHGGTRPTSFRIPSVDGKFAIEVPVTDREPGDQEKPQERAELKVYKPGVEENAIAIPDVAIQGQPRLFGSWGCLSPERQYILIPAAKLLITHPESRTRLRMRRVDIGNLLN